MTENTIENKARFLSQYWGQQNLFAFPVPGIFKNKSFWWNRYPQECLLLLTPLEHITDEDAIEVARIVNSWDPACGFLDISDIPGWLDEVLTGNCAMHADYVSGYQFIQLCDFLRSRSYAMPFHDLSVTDLISYGWVKLKTK